MHSIVDRGSNGPGSGSRSMVQDLRRRNQEEEEEDEDESSEDSGLIRIDRLDAYKFLGITSKTMNLLN